MGANMIDDNRRYEFVTTQIRYHNEKMIEAFNRLIQLFTAIVGGSIWLSLQPRPAGVPLRDYSTISDTLVLALAAISALNIINDLLAWFGFRQTESSLVGHNKLPPPHVIRSCWMEYLMLIGMLAATVAFWRFNPLAN
jgi:hypothetical protein